MALLSLAAYWIGQANDNSGPPHPVGYVTSQRWSTTATQWKSQLDVMTADRDNWITTSNSWQNAANQSWGPSRVYNSGSSWEALYNDMVNQRNTWINNANSAWGASRSYGSGESWEAAYNRVLPPSGPVFSSANGSFTGSYAVVLDTVTDRSGYWVAWFRGSWSNAPGVGASNFELWIGGSLVDSAQPDVGGSDDSGHSAVGLSYTGTTLSAGTHIQVRGNHGGPGDSASGTLYILFVPTQSFPH